MADLSSKRYFEDRDHAENYKKYRSELPGPIIGRIVHFLEESFDISDCVGVDVGCGSGQSTKPLSYFLKRVVGIDISPEQIAAVGKDIPSNAEFKIGSYDNIPLPDRSVHLVTAVNSAHWFELEKFYAEVDRVLVPNGVLAIVRGTPVLEIKGCEAESQKLYFELRAKTSAYWDKSIEASDYMYNSVNLPHRFYVRDLSVVTEDKVPLSYVFGRVRTFSGIAKCLKEDPDKCKPILEEFENKLMKAAGGAGKPPGSKLVTLKRQFVLLMGRKE